MLVLSRSFTQALLYREQLHLAENQWIADRCTANDERQKMRYISFGGSGEKWRSFHSWNTVR